LDLADQYAKSLGTPVVLLVRGLSGSGKSTIAELISQEIGSPLLQTDVIRREMFPEPMTNAPYNDGLYSLENRERVYGTVHARAEKLVAQGRSVVLDGTYLAHEMRQEAADIAKRNGAELVCIRCDCPEALAIDRISTRAHGQKTDSDARPDFRRLQRKEEDPPNVATISVDTSQGTVEPVRTILAALREACLPGEFSC
jgi:predicted kinase